MINHTLRCSYLHFSSGHETRLIVVTGEAQLLGTYGEELSIQSVNFCLWSTERAQTTCLGWMAV